MMPVYNGTAQYAKYMAVTTAWTTADSTTAPTWGYTDGRIAGDYNGNQIGWEWRPAYTPPPEGHNIVKCKHCEQTLVIDLARIKEVITVLDCPKCGSPLDV